MPFCKEIPTEVLLQEIGDIPFVSVGGFFGPNCIFKWIGFVGVGQTIL